MIPSEKKSKKLVRQAVALTAWRATLQQPILEHRVRTHCSRWVANFLANRGRWHGTTLDCWLRWRTHTHETSSQRRAAQKQDRISMAQHVAANVTSSAFRKYALIAVVRAWHAYVKEEKTRKDQLCTNFQYAAVAVAAKRRTFLALNGMTGRYCWQLDAQWIQKVVRLWAMLTLRRSTAKRFFMTNDEWCQRISFYGWKTYHAKNCTLRRELDRQRLVSNREWIYHLSSKFYNKLQQRILGSWHRAIEIQREERKALEHHRSQQSILTRKWARRLMIGNDVWLLRSCMQAWGSECTKVRFAQDMERRRKLQKVDEMRLWILRLTSENDEQLVQTCICAWSSFTEQCRIEQKMRVQQRQVHEEKAGKWVARMMSDNALMLGRFALQTWFSIVRKEQAIRKRHNEIRKVINMINSSSEWICASYLHAWSTEARIRKQTRLHSQLADEGSRRREEEIMRRALRLLTDHNFMILRIYLQTWNKEIEKQARRARKNESNLRFFITWWSRLTISSRLKRHEHISKMWESRFVSVIHGNSDRKLMTMVWTCWAKYFKVWSGYYGLLNPHGVEIWVQRGPLGLSAVVLRSPALQDSADECVSTMTKPSKYATTAIKGDERDSATTKVDNCASTAKEDECYTTMTKEDKSDSTIRKRDQCAAATINGNIRDSTTAKVGEQVHTTESKSKRSPQETKPRQRSSQHACANGDKEVEYSSAFDSAVASEGLRSTTRSTATTLSAREKTFINKVPGNETPIVRNSLPNKPTNVSDIFQRLSEDLSQRPLKRHFNQQTMAKRKLKTTILNSSGARCIDMDENGRRLAVGTAHGPIVIYNWDSAHSDQTLEGHEQLICDVDFSNDVVLSASMDATVRLWTLGRRDGKTVAPCKTFSDHTKEVCGVARHPHADYFVSCSADHSWILWNVHAGLASQQKHDDTLRKVEVHPHGLLCCAAAANGIYLWDLSTSTRATRLESKNVVDVSFSPDGVFVASVLESGIFNVWDLRRLDKPTVEKSVCVVPSPQRGGPGVSGETNAVSNTPARCGRCVEFDPSGRLLGIGLADSLHVYAARSANFEHCFNHGEVVTDACFSLWSVVTCSATSLKIWA